MAHLQETYPLIVDLRGLGLMIGAEFTDSDGRPDKDTAKAVVHSCLERRLLLLTCGTRDNTIRFIPSLVVTSEQIDHALEIFTESLTEMTG